MNTLIIGHGEDTVEMFHSWHKEQKQIHRKSFVRKTGQKYFKKGLVSDIYFNGERVLPELEFLSDAVEEYYANAKKDTNAIINRNNEYFKSLSEIKHIYILGHSLAKVDLPYIIKIMEVNNNQTGIIWYVSYYSKEQKDQYKQVLMNLGINETQIYMLRLSDLNMNKKRLSSNR